MNVEYSFWGKIDDRLRNNLPVSDHYHHVRVEASEQLYVFGSANAFRLMYRQTKSDRRSFHRRFCHNAAASLWTIRLRDHGHHFKAALNECLESWDRKLWRAQKNSAHRMLYIVRREAPGSNSCCKRSAKFPPDSVSSSRFSTGSAFSMSCTNRSTLRTFDSINLAPPGTSSRGK